MEIILTGVDIASWLFCFVGLFFMCFSIIFIHISEVKDLLKEKKQSKVKEDKHEST